MAAKLRHLSIALSAVVALCAATATSAQAGTLDIGADPAVVTGHSELQQILAVKFPKYK